MNKGFIHQVSYTDNLWIRKKVSKSPKMGD